MPEPGTILHSRYQIVRQVGEGGLGVVFEAVDNELNARVAIKEMVRVSPEPMMRLHMKRACWLTWIILCFPALPIGSRKEGVTT